MRAAFLHSRGDLFGRPFDDGIIRALLDAGFEIDHYSPGAEADASDLYGPAVRRWSIEYNSGWLKENWNLARTRKHSILVGNTDLPMAFAGVLGMVARSPTVCACDEIYIGGYQGAARRYWKTITKWAMRRAAFTVITDPVRIPLQRRFAALSSNHPFYEYPSCFSDFDSEDFDPGAVRRELGIAQDDLVLSFSGNVSAPTGGEWAVRLERMLRESWKVLLQPGGVPEPLLHALFESLAERDSLIYRPERLEWMESVRLMSAADVGLVVYLSRKPQFQAMGVSSTKLCTYLSLGIPVVATRQESFRFVEDHNCGILVDQLSEVRPALDRIMKNYSHFSSNALECVADYIRPGEKRRVLAEAFRRLGRG